MGHSRFTCSKEWDQIWDQIIRFGAHCNRVILKGNGKGRGLTVLSWPGNLNCLLSLVPYLQGGCRGTLLHNQSSRESAWLQAASVMLRDAESSLWDHATRAPIPLPMRARPFDAYAVFNILETLSPRKASSREEVGKGELTILKRYQTRER